MNEEIIDLTNSVTNGQIQPKVFTYKVNTSLEEFILSVIAPNAHTAKEVIKQQLGSGIIISYICTSTKIMQVN